ncbi:hypothetical protein JCM6882_007394 [Rhodosporidiobolus microsporus]
MTSQQQYLGSHSLGGARGGAGGGGGQGAANNTVDPVLLAPAASTANAHSHPFTAEEDLNIGFQVLKQLQKHPSWTAIKWSRIAEKLSEWGRTAEEWEGRWAQLKWEVSNALVTLTVHPHEGAIVGQTATPWTPVDDSLLLASAKHLVTHHRDPASTDAALKAGPSSSPASCAAWSLARERTLVGKNVPATESTDVHNRSLKSCHSRYVVLRTKADDVRAAYAVPHASGANGGAWTKAQEHALSEAMVEQGAALTELGGGWNDERERVAKWVVVKGDGFSNRNFLDLTSKWEEKRVDLLAGAIENAMPEPVEPPPKKRTVSSPSEPKKRRKKDSESPEHAHQPWTSAADSDLRRLHLEGNSWAVVADQLGRTKASVTARWQQHKGEWRGEGLLNPLTSSSSPHPSTSSSRAPNGDIFVNGQGGSGANGVNGEEADEEDETEEESEEESE